MKIEVKGDKELEALKGKLMRWATVAPKELEKALKRAAEMVISETKQRHLSGPRMPRGVGANSSGFGNATLGVQTGRLRSSITKAVTVNPHEVRAIVGTNVVYAPRHEFGLDEMPERPFLRPSLEAKRSEMFKYIEEAFFRSYGK